MTSFWNAQGGGVRFHVDRDPEGDYIREMEARNDAEEALMPEVDWPAKFREYESRPWSEQHVSWLGEQGLKAIEQLEEEVRWLKNLIVEAAQTDNAAGALVAMGQREGLED